MASFRIKPNDPYLDFFRNQNEDPLQGDPYDPIPQETLDLRASQPIEEEPDFWTNLGKSFGPKSPDESLPDNRFAEQANQSVGEFGSFLKNAVLHPIDTAKSVIESPFHSAQEGLNDALSIAQGVMPGTSPSSFRMAQTFATPEQRPGIPEGVKAGLKMALPIAAPGSEILTSSAGKLAEGDIQGGAAELAVLGLGGALLHKAGGGLVEGLKEIPKLAEKHVGSLPFEYSSDPGMFGGDIKLKKYRKDTYQGQEVKVLGRRGNSVKIELPDGTSKTVGFSSLGEKQVRAPIEAPKSKYEDIVKELESLTGDEETTGSQVSVEPISTQSLDERLGRPEGYTEPGKIEIPEESPSNNRLLPMDASIGIGDSLDQFPTYDTEPTFINDKPKSWAAQEVDRIRKEKSQFPEKIPFVKEESSQPHIIDQLSDLEKSFGGEETPIIDPQDVSIVLPDKNIIPEYASFNKVGRPGKQGPNLPPGSRTRNIGSVPPRIPNEPPSGDIPEFPGEKPKSEDWLKTAAREVPKIERGQNQEIIRDQGFRDQIKLQDQILKGQEQEALKSGKAEEAQKVNLERRILRAQNEEVFNQFKEEQRTKIKSEKEQLALQNKILKGQESEALALRKQKEAFVGEDAEGVKPNSAGQWLLDLFRVPAALKASGDIPALSHARYDTLAHPIDAMKRLKTAGKAVFSPAEQTRVLKEIADDPMFQDSIKAGIQYTKQGYDLGAQSFGSYTAEHSLGPISEVVKGSERGQNVYLDKARMDRFKKLMEDAGIKNFDQDPKSAKEIAKLANVSTGYGKLDSVSGENTIRALNTVMWSARKRLARAQHLKMLGEAINPASEMNPTVRKEIFRQAVPTIAIGLSLLKLAQDQGAKVDWDPRNSNFMKARFPTESDKYIAWGPFGDYTGLIKLASQELSGTKSTDKGEYDLDDPKGPFAPTRKSLVQDYMYNSLNPSARGIWDSLDPNTESADSPFLDVDEHPSLSKGLEGITPINVSNEKQLYDELGPVSSLFAPFIIAGENIDVYDPNRFTKQKERLREERGLERKPSKKKGKRKGKVLSTY